MIYYDPREKEAFLRAVKKYPSKVICDICDEEIPIYTPGYKDETKKYKFYRITTGHNDWGNDSIESRETKDVCVKCLTSFISDKIKEYSKSTTDYIELNAKMVSSYEFETEYVEV